MPIGCQPPAPPPLRRRPGRLIVLVAGSLFVAAGTLLMGVDGRWWGLVGGVGGLLLLAGAWTADLRPPSAGSGRTGRPGRSERSRRWAWQTVLAGLLVLVVCAVAGLIIGNPTISFVCATAVVGAGLVLTGPGYTGRPKRRRA